MRSKLTKSVAVPLLCLALLLSGCAARGGGAAQNPSGGAPEDPGENGQSTSSPPAPQAAGTGYIAQVAGEVAASIAEPGMGEYDKAKAAFDYMIANTYMTDPVGLNLWRVRGDGGAQPSFVENRSLSVLLYGVGMCEDYAAAFTTLLRAMGLEAEYVPGLTYSAQGTGLVDHAWTVAKIDGVWYHLDPQLEDNISRHDTIRYKYFMRGDATLIGSHRWGRNLIDAGLLTAAQNEELAANFLYEPCPQDYPTPAPQIFTPADKPNTAALQSAIDEEIAAYEFEHGPLEPLELFTIPPVFGLEGYGPPE